MYNNIVISNNVWIAKYSPLNFGILGWHKKESRQQVALVCIDSHVTSLQHYRAYVVALLGLGIVCCV